MAVLRTDYQDDVLDLTQNSQRCFEEIENQDGSKSFRDVTVYEREGDNYGATDLNATNEQVNSNTTAVTNKVKLNSEAINTINFQLSGNTLTITTS